MKGASHILATAVLNFMSSACANAANVLLVRFKEARDGVEVSNEDATLMYGVSRKAGRRAILETAISRALLPLPVFLLPAVTHIILGTLGLWPRRAILSKMAELSLLGLSLTIALPWSISLFNRRAMILRE